jgi:hypothetical protein
LRLRFNQEWLDNPAIVTWLRFDGKIIRNRKRDGNIHFHDHAWKRHDDRLDYWYRLEHRLNLNYTTKQNSTGETFKLYRTRAQWRRWMHRANYNRERHIRH